MYDLVYQCGTDKTVKLWGMSDEGDINPEPITTILGKVSYNFKPSVKKLFTYFDKIVKFLKPSWKQKCTVLEVEKCACFNQMLALSWKVEKCI